MAISTGTWWMTSSMRMPINFWKRLDGYIFGRKTYELMANYWPSEAALQDDPVTARYMNSLHKYVVSRSLKEVKWENSSLLGGDPAAEITRLKQQPGKDLAIFGSSDLVVSLDQPRAD